MGSSVRIIDPHSAPPAVKARKSMPLPQNGGGVSATAMFPLRTGGSNQAALQAMSQLKADQQPAVNDATLTRHPIAKLPPLSPDTRQQMMADVETIVSILKGGKPNKDEQTELLGPLRKWERQDQASSPAQRGGRSTPLLDHFLILLKGRDFSRRTWRSLGITQKSIVYDTLWYDLDADSLEEFKRMVKQSETERTEGAQSQESENGAALIAKQEAMGLWGMLKGMGTGLVSMAGPEAAQYIGAQFDETAQILFGHEWDSSEPLVWGMNASQIGTAGGDVIIQLATFARTAGAKGGKVLKLLNNLDKLKRAQQVLGSLSGAQGLLMATKGMAELIEAKRKAGEKITADALLHDTAFVNQLVMLLSSGVGIALAVKGAPPSAQVQQAATHARIGLLLSTLQVASAVAELSRIAQSNSSEADKEREYGQVIAGLIPQLVGLVIAGKGHVDAKRGAAQEHQEQTLKGKDPIKEQAKALPVEELPPPAELTLQKAKHDVSEGIEAITTGEGPAPPKSPKAIDPHETTFKPLANAHEAQMPDEVKNRLDTQEVPAVSSNSVAGLRDTHDTPPPHREKSEAIGQPQTTDEVALIQPTERHEPKSETHDVDFWDSKGSITLPKSSMEQTVGVTESNTETSSKAAQQRQPLRPRPQPEASPGKAMNSSAEGAMPKKMPSTHEALEQGRKSIADAHQAEMQNEVNKRLGPRNAPSIPDDLAAGLREPHFAPPARGEKSKTIGPPHATLEAALQAYDHVLAETGGQYEAGIWQHPDTGEYFVQLGHPTSVDPPDRDTSWRSVQHFHPNTTDVPLWRMPSSADVSGLVSQVMRQGSTVTELVEYPLPNGQRGRAAYTVTNKGQLIVQFIGPEGQPVTKLFNKVEDYKDYHPVRKVAADPSIRADVDAWLKARRNNQPPSPGGQSMHGATPESAAAAKSEPEVSPSKAISASSEGPIQDLLQPTTTPGPAGQQTAIQPSKKVSGFETGRATPGRQVKAGTLEGLEPTAQKPGGDPTRGSRTMGKREAAEYAAGKDTGYVLPSRNPDWKGRLLGIEFSVQAGHTVPKSTGKPGGLAIELTSLNQAKDSKLINKEAVEIRGAIVERETALRLLVSKQFPNLTREMIVNAPKHAGWEHQKGMSESDAQAKFMKDQLEIVSATDHPLHQLSISYEEMTADLPTRPMIIPSAQ